MKIYFRIVLVIQAITFFLLAYFAALYISNGIQEGQRRAEQEAEKRELEILKQSCLLFDPHFTDAEFLDGTPYCIGSDVELEIPLELIIQTTEGQ